MWVFGASFGDGADFSFFFFIRSVVKCVWFERRIDVKSGVMVERVIYTARYVHFWGGESCDVCKIVILMCLTQKVGFS